MSHNAFRRVGNNGKTLCAIFSGWPSDKLAQLYFRAEVPDTTICSNFYCVTDRSMLFDEKSKVGMRVDVNLTGMTEQFRAQMLPFGGRYSGEFVSLVRNIVWSSRKWDNERFRAWLQDFSPEVIFFMAGGNAFAYDIVNKIAADYSIPVFLYYTDDYISPRPTLNLFWWINWWWLRRALRRLSDRVEGVFVVGEDMAKEYELRFGRPCIPIMNAVNTAAYHPDDVSHQERVGSSGGVRIGYFGGLHLNRWKTLATLAKAIEKYVQQFGVGVSLDIYSSSIPDKRILSVLNKPPFSRYVGSVNPDVLIDVMKNYDVLVHVESFSFADRYKTRLSVSTKIPEYLASGKTILAIGPKQVASIRYLSKNEVAFVVTSRRLEDLELALKRLVDEPDTCEQMRRRAVALAQKNHDIHRNIEIMRFHLCQGSLSERGTC